MNEAFVSERESEPSSVQQQFIHIPQAFISGILKPYRPNVQYLKSAQIDFFRDAALDNNGDQDPALIKGRGRFEIPESCYIDDTGHFNAVEFNICYNQLAYVMFGKCVADGIWGRVAQKYKRLADVSFAEYQRLQLSSMLIVKLESSFLKQLKSDDFWGELTIHRIASKEKVDFIYTSISFSDSGGVKSEGSVVLVFNPVVAA
jgi:hypothetical protein